MNGGNSAKDPKEKKKKRMIESVTCNMLNKINSPSLDQKETI